MPAVFTMRYAIDDKQVSYFQDNGMLELADILSLDRLELINRQIDTILDQRIESSEEGEGYTPDQLVQGGRDLWREGNELKKFVFSRNLLHIISTLVGVRLMRLGCDQLLPGGVKIVGELPLQDLFCFQGMCAAMIICLKGGEEEGILPQTPGSVQIVSPRLPIDLSALRTSKGRYLLVTFLQEKAHYIEQLRDPHAQHLKSMGYGFGDRLNEETHPLVCRR